MLPLAIKYARHSRAVKNMAYFSWHDDRRYSPASPAWFRHDAGIEELLRLLEGAETAREGLDHAMTALRILLRENPHLQSLWWDFQQSGGISARDLRRWSPGKRIGDGVIARRHLRLVVSNVCRPAH
jgi:hypothetical protein